MSDSGGTVSPAKVSLEDFTLIKVIGKGTYGKVMLVRHKHVCGYMIWFKMFFRTMQYMP